MRTQNIPLTRTAQASLNIWQESVVPAEWDLTDIVFEYIEGKGHIQLLIYLKVPKTNLFLLNLGFMAI